MAAVQTIDFCLDDTYRIDWLQNFPNIRELHMVNHALNEIEGIEKCRFLERVWFT